MTATTAPVKLHAEGLRLRPGSPLVPGLRRLRDPEGGAEGAGRPRGAAGRRPCSCPASAVRRAFRTTCPPTGSTRSTGARPPIATGVKLANPEPRRLGDHRRRRRAVHRRQPHAARAPPQRGPADPALQQRDLRPDQGPVLADVAPGHQDAPPRRGARSSAALIRRRLRARRRGRGSSPAASTPSRRTWSRCSSGPTRHRGASFVEIFQNCVVFNDGVFDEFTERAVADERQLHVEHGKPLLFGKDRKQGLRLDASALALEVVTVGENGASMEDDPGPRRDQPRAGRDAGRAGAAGPGGHRRPLLRAGAGLHLRGVRTAVRRAGGRGVPVEAGEDLEGVAAGQASG